MIKQIWCLWAPDQRKAFQKIWENSIKIQDFSKSITSLIQTTTTNTADTHTYTDRRKKDRKKNTVIHALCQHTHSFYTGTSNRKLTVLCDSMECSEVLAGNDELNPTTMASFVLIFLIFDVQMFPITHLIMGAIGQQIFGQMLVTKLFLELIDYHSR